MYFALFQCQCPEEESPLCMVLVRVWEFLNAGGDRVPTQLVGYPLESSESLDFPSTSGLLCFRVGTPGFRKLGESSHGEFLVGCETPLYMSGIHAGKYF